MRYFYDGGRVPLPSLYGPHPFWPADMPFTVLQRIPLVYNLLRTLCGQK